MALILRLLTLAAVLLMPLGMAAAPAMAHDSAHAGMPMQHCPDQGSKPETKGALAECTMACSAALPAQEAAQQSTPHIAPMPVVPVAAQMLHGLHPETATPPPKHS
jgi:hypothetical protein